MESQNARHTSIQLYIMEEVSQGFGAQKGVAWRRREAKAVELGVRGDAEGVAVHIDQASYTWPEVSPSRGMCEATKRLCSGLLRSSEY